MDDLPFAKRVVNRIAGYLYAVLYISSDRLLIGASLLGWITLLLVILGGYFWVRSGEIAWFVGFLVLVVIVRVAHWMAKRSGFIVFTEQDAELPPPNVGLIEDFEKFVLLVSGTFSVTGREEYMFRRPTELWRVPFGDHALMVERPSGRYLYQFIEEGHIREIRPGCLVYGSQVIHALEINFKTTWGPVAGETEFKWYAPRDKSKPKRYKRTLYLGFKESLHRDAIWRSLLTGRTERKNKMTIKAIIFDFGEVLTAPVDQGRAEERRDRLAARLGLKPDDLWPYLFDSESSKLWMTGKLDWEDFWKATLMPRGIEDPEEIRSFTEEVFADHGMLHPDMVELTASLKGRYKLAVLSNASRTEEEMEAIFKNDFDLPSELFDAVVTSTSFGAVKPDLGIFKEVLQRLNVSPEEAVFADDMEEFTAAAASLGIHVHTFKTPYLFRQFLGEMGVSV